jgi:hypothetical protein
MSRFTENTDDCKGYGAEITFILAKIAKIYQHKM